MPVAGVEDATLALRLQPGPRLTRLTVHTLHDDRALSGSDGRERLFPRREGLQPLDDRVRRLNDFGGELRTALRHDLRANE